jgi:hypothetical protein
MSRRRVMMMLILGGSLSWETKAFVSRVEADGGVIESIKCVDKKLSRVTYSGVTEDFIARTIDDSGVIESPECIDLILKF